MRSEQNGDTFGCITFKESLVGGPPWFRDLEICPIGFGNYLNSLFIFTCFLIIDFLACHVLMFIMLNAMLIRLMTYMCSN